MRFRVLGLVAGVLILLTPGLMADTINISHDGGLNGVTIGTESSGLVFSGTLTTFVGAFNLEFTSGSFAGQTINAYCVDLAHGISNPLNGASATVAFNLNTWNLGSAQSPAAGGGEAVSYILNNWASAANTDAKKAGLQLAIWEVLYDTNFNLSQTAGTDGFYVSAANGADLGFANQVLADVQAASTSGSNAWWVQTDNLGQKGTQDFGFNVPVPEPSALLLLGSGLLGLGYFRRRRS